MGSFQCMLDVALLMIQRGCFGQWRNMMWSHGMRF
uniref:Uncharacterized protein n=1 Tax=Rhizophora mucronata TaxID=61149 RepID=A0A2P2IY25_RHIMU